MKKKLLTKEYFDKRVNNLKTLILGVLFWLIAIIDMVYLEPTFLNSFIIVILLLCGIFLVIKSTFFEGSKR